MCDLSLRHCFTLILVQNAPSATTGKWHAGRVEQMAVPVAIVWPYNIGLSEVAFLLQLRLWNDSTVIRAKPQRSYEHSTGF
jgi:hypothetical protein